MTTLKEAAKQYGILYLVKDLQTVQAYNDRYSDRSLDNFKKIKTPDKPFPNDELVTIYGRQFPGSPLSEMVGKHNKMKYILVHLIKLLKNKQQDFSQIIQELTSLQNWFPQIKEIQFNLDIEKATIASEQFRRLLKLLGIPVSDSQLYPQDSKKSEYNSVSLHQVFPRLKFLADTYLNSLDKKSINANIQGVHVQFRVAHAMLAIPLVMPFYFLFISSQIRREYWHRFDVTILANQLTNATNFSYQPYSEFLTESKVRFSQSYPPKLLTSSLEIQGIVVILYGAVTFYVLMPAHMLLSSTGLPSDSFLVPLYYVFLILLQVLPLLGYYKISGSYKELSIRYTENSNSIP